MTNAMLEARSLHKFYGDFTAVDDVSFSLQEGEFLTFLGPSGSGKTTTLQMISGLTSPNRGEIMLDGTPLVPLPPHKRNIGVVFQNYALFPHMTVEGNVAFPLKARGIPASERRKKVNRILEVVGLPNMGHRYPAQLSGGQQQRVALARAMVFQPRLLLMDEPLGALDKKLREQIQLEIVRLHKEMGMTIVYVTHDQEEALVMSDRIAVFEDGKIEQLSTAMEMYERPRTLFIADFIGDSNILPVKVVGQEEAWFLLDAGTPLRGRRDDRVQPGDAASLIVRPERLTVEAADAVEISGCNRLLGQVDSVIYLGKSLKYLISADNGAKITALEQRISGEEAGVYGEGSRVAVSWKWAESLVLPGQV